MVKLKFSIFLHLGNMGVFLKFIKKEFIFINIWVKWIIFKTLSQMSS